MKKLNSFLFLLSILLASGVQAQEFGLHAGINLGNASSEGFDGPGIDRPALVGPIFGVVADFPLTDKIHFRPELNYIQKGFKRKVDEPGFGSASISARLNYLELPLNFAYGIPAGKNKVLVGIGPTLGFGLSGKAKDRYEPVGEPVEEEEYDINFGSDEMEDDLKAMDLGLNFFLAFQMQQGMFFKAGYNIGLSNLSHDDEAAYRNKGFGITVGYMFKKMSKNK